MAFGTLCYRFNNIYYIELVFMPCLIYELEEKSDIKSIVGWVGVLVAALSDTIFDFLTENAKSKTDGSFLDYLNYSSKYENMRNWVFAAAILLIPLILFERREKLERVIIPIDNDDDDFND